MLLNRHVLIILVIIILVALVVYLVESHAAKTPTAFELNNRTYAITAYAYTPQQQEKGLMNTTVTNATFMLFYFNKPGIYPFWMKDTYGQLDIMWLNYSPSIGMARVVYIVNATPCINYSKNQDNCTIYAPNAYANYVLETKYGFVEESNINIGSQIKFLFK